MANSLFAAQVPVMAELLGLARAMEVDPAPEVEILGSAPVASPAVKGAVASMLAQSFAPAFPNDLVVKDLRPALQPGALPRLCRLPSARRRARGLPMRTLSPSCSAKSGDDVGDQPILDLRDLVFQRQLLLFQPAQGQLVRAAGLLKREDGLVKITMLTPENLKLDAKHFLETEFGWGVHGHRLASCLSQTIQESKADSGRFLRHTATIPALMPGLAGRGRPPHIHTVRCLKTGPRVKLSLEPRTCRNDETELWGPSLSSGVRAA
jgi:NAD-binding of NADP-dependent 3-hydroxyisobutyrate dehydrogenase